MENISNGSRKNYQRGTTIFENGEHLDKLCLLVKGRVCARNSYLSFEMEGGAILGILDLCEEEYIFDYEAITDVTVILFDCQSMDDMKKLLLTGKDYQNLTVMTMLNQFNVLYDLYKNKLEPYATEITELSKVEHDKLEMSVDKEQCSYIYEISRLDKKMLSDLFTGSTVIASQHIQLASLVAAQIHHMALCFSDVLSAEQEPVAQEAITKETEQVNTNMSLDNTENQTLDQETLRIKEELQDSLQKILDYAGLQQQDAMRFQMLIRNYRRLPDKNSQDSAIRDLRKNITELYYIIYEKVCIKALKDPKKTRIIRMFLDYGYMDERDFDWTFLRKLYQLGDITPSGKYGVYSVFDWLSAIYKGDREPSKDEFDNDYNDHLRTIKKDKQLTREEINQYSTDQEGKARFEIHNLIRITNRLTSNEITTFCPLLNQSRFIQDPQHMQVSAERLEHALDTLQQIDYSLFYREQMYYDASKKIDNVIIEKKVYPDIILMPNVGGRGVMWQDITGKKRDTAARFILPAFLNGDLDHIMLHIAGAFRWELCRTIQGNYWNDVREHSLTSEYCDYVQFYRKNRDLTEETKERVHAQYKSCRNSIKEMFIKDYEIWIRYESMGSIRLNKIARKILYNYCPFEKSYREKLKTQPVYEEGALRFERERLKKVREYKAFNIGVQRRNGVVTDLLFDNLAFYEDM
jgi:CRP-like cAMP-binding protein